MHDFALGGAHSCAIVNTSLYCWGQNSSGQLGLGDVEPRLHPTEVTGLRAPPVDIASYSHHTCALLADGGIACFGANEHGQVGSGTTEPARSPTLVPLSDAIDIAAGSRHTCALRRDGSIWCWGDGSLGQLGDGSTEEEPRLTPTRVTLDRPAFEIAAGSGHTCARTADGVYCWGDNFRGQTGQEASTAIIALPTRVPELSGVEEITAGAYHTCVRIGAGQHRCFGANNTGQLGGGTIGGESHLPVEVIAW